MNNDEGVCTTFLCSINHTNVLLEGLDEREKLLQISKSLYVSEGH